MRLLHSGQIRRVLVVTAARNPPTQEITTHAFQRRSGFHQILPTPEDGRKTVLACCDACSRLVRWR
jgi:hypothetical protein